MKNIAIRKITIAIFSSVICVAATYQAIANEVYENKHSTFGFSSQHELTEEEKIELFTKEADIKANYFLKSQANLEKEAKQREIKRLESMIFVAKQKLHGKTPLYGEEKADLENIIEGARIEIARLKAEEELIKDETTQEQLDKVKKQLKLYPNVNAKDINRFFKFDKDTVNEEEEEEEEVFTLDDILNSKNGLVVANQPLQLTQEERQSIRKIIYAAIKSKKLSIYEREILNALIFNYGLQLLDTGEIIILDTYLPQYNPNAKPMLTPDIPLPEGTIIMNKDLVKKQSSSSDEPQGHIEIAIPAK